MFIFGFQKPTEEPRGSCSIILASLVLKLGTFGILKFRGAIVERFTRLSRISVSLAVFGSLIFRGFMFRYFDLKYLIASSSVIHISIITPAAFISRSMSSLISVLIIVAHGFVSLFLFFLVTIIYEGRQTRRVSSNKYTESICKTFTIIFYLTIFLNLGVPPLINFTRELGFCSVISTFSILALIIFTLGLIARIFFTIMLCSTLLFGKKMFKSQMKRSVVEPRVFFYIISLLTFSSIIIYFFSLI